MNSDRLKLNRRKDKMFIPMNVEGGGYDEKFFNTSKILTIVGIAVGWVVVITWLNSLQNATFVFRLIFILAMLFISSLLVRFVIFEENYFFKMYKKTLTYANPTSDVFWNISSIKDTHNGSILLFSDLKIGVFVKLKRGSIIGKNQDFMEQHFDAVSDFLSEIVGRGYMFVHLNMMERADNDDRLDKLAVDVSKTANPNMKRLLELQTGHLRNTTRDRLYESDYYLIYTDRAERFDMIIRDVEDCLELALDGSYNGYFELDKKETIEVHKELIGVSYFDYNSATVNTFREFQIDDTPAVTIKRINLVSGSSVDISKSDDALLRKIANNIDSGVTPSSGVNILKLLAKGRNSDYRLRAGIDLDKDSDIPSSKDTTARVDTGIIKGALKSKKKNKANESKNQKYGLDLSDIELDKGEKFMGYENNNDLSEDNYLNEDTYLSENEDYIENENLSENEDYSENYGENADYNESEYPIENPVEDDYYDDLDENTENPADGDNGEDGDSSLDYNKILNSLNDEDDEEIVL